MNPECAAFQTYCGAGYSAKENSRKIIWHLRIFDFVTRITISHILNGLICLEWEWWRKNVRVWMISDCRFTFFCSTLARYFCKVIIKNHATQKMNLNTPVFEQRVFCLIDRNKRVQHFRNHMCFMQYFTGHLLFIETVSSDTRRCDRHCRLSTPATFTHRSAKCNLGTFYPRHE